MGGKTLLKLEFGGKPLSELYIYTTEVSNLFFSNNAAFEFSSPGLRTGRAGPV